MANQIHVNEVAAKSGRRGRSAASKTGRERWLAADAARFLFKGQCYDAGLASDTTCRLCAEQILSTY